MLNIILMVLTVITSISLIINITNKLNIDKLSLQISNLTRTDEPNEVINEIINNHIKNHRELLNESEFYRQFLNKDESKILDFEKIHQYISQYISNAPNINKLQNSKAVDIMEQITQLGIANNDISLENKTARKIIESAKYIREKLNEDTI